MEYSNTSYKGYFYFLWHPLLFVASCVNHIFLVLYFNFTFCFGKCLLHSNSNFEWNHPNAAWVSDRWYISFQSKLARSSPKASLLLCDIFLLYMKSSFTQSLFSKSTQKMGRWSKTSVTRRPWNEFSIFVELVKILSIKVAVVDVILVGRFINDMKECECNRSTKSDVRVWFS